MDEAFNQHSSYARRKNRSTGTLNSLSLAPLTTKLPLPGDDGRVDDSIPGDLFAAPPRYAISPSSYLQGKSAPTTPRLISRSPPPRRAAAHVHARRSSIPAAALPKSKSATHLSVSSHARRSGSDAAPSAGSKRRRDDHHAADADWIFRAGALISTETRESKGQSWLISRESSTSLAGLRNAAAPLGFDGFDDDNDDDDGDGDDDGDAIISPAPASRSQSRPLSRVGSRSGRMMVTPSEQRSPPDGYFPAIVAGPDFVNLDERLESVRETADPEDEAHVRRLVKRGKAAGVGTWFDSVLGWGLFSVEEHEDESDTDGGEEGDDETEIDGEQLARERRRSSVSRRFEGFTTAVEEERMPPPRADEGGWRDAAWLLSVASKVLL